MQRTLGKSTECYWDANLILCEPWVEAVTPCVFTGDPLFQQGQQGQQVTGKNDHVRTLKNLQSMSEFGGLRKQLNTQHALKNNS